MRTTGCRRVRSSLLALLRKGWLHSASVDTRKVGFIHLKWIWLGMCGDFHSRPRIDYPVMFVNLPRLAGLGQRRCWDECIALHCCPCALCCSEEGERLCLVTAFWTWGVFHGFSPLNCQICPFWVRTRTAEADCPDHSRYCFNRRVDPFPRLKLHELDLVAVPGWRQSCRRLE